MNINDTSLYKEHVALKQEVDKHKWYESEKVGHDIGFAAAIIDWTMKFKTEWLKSRRLYPTPTPSC